MKYNFKSMALFALGLILSVLPPFIATLSYFSIWRERGSEYVISGFTLIILMLCAVPLFRTLKAKLKSPASYIIWLIIFILFYTTSKIADEMVIIAFVGFVSNVIGAVLFALSKRYRRDEE